MNTVNQSGLSVGVPADTQVVSDRGIVIATDVRAGDNLLSYDLANDTMRWEECQRVDVHGGRHRVSLFEARRTTFRFGTDLPLPVFSAPSNVKGHCYYGRESSRRFLSSEGLTTQHCFIRTAPFGDCPSILTPEQSRLLGWLVTDGYHRWRGKHLEAVLYQSPSKPWFDHVCQIAGGKPRKPHPTTGVVCVPITQERLDPLRSYLEHGKTRLPWIAARLSPVAVEAMYSAMMQAEGSITRPGTKREGHTFVQASGPVLDTFVILTLLMGRLPSVCSTGAPGETTFSSSKRTYCVNISRAHRSAKVASFVRSCGVVETALVRPVTSSGTWISKQGQGFIVVGGPVGREGGPR